MRAWDLPTRVFHWSLVVLVAAAWASATFAETLRDATYVWHRTAGYAVLVLVVWRLLWGLVGSSTSRFDRFVRSPFAALRYGCDLLTGRPRHFLGHNPLGAYMILALLATLLVQSTLGLFTVEHNDLASGPLARFADEALEKTIRRWHHFTFDRVLLGLVGLHVLANVLYGVVKGEPLVRAMVTGHKPAGAYEDVSGQPVGRPIGRALFVLAVAASLTLGGVLLVAGRL